ncbi:M48 family metallopeptidase [Acidiphilium sp.]|uniref:M48 family metallopeptidase n=1 Tax=Acidiphilium sp. TaxID=527 RepID=UPI002585FEC4|nr:SprT family zinc-dependent metalloprotease [Acidiphilium sp.]
MDAMEEILALPGGPTMVRWRRHAQARRVSLRIDPRGGGVVVTLPARAGRRAGMALLMTHADWVAERIAALPRAVAFADGAEIPIDGVAHRIRHLPKGDPNGDNPSGARGSAWVAAGTLYVTGGTEFLTRRVGDFLRAEAGRRLTALAVAKAAMIERRPARIAVKDTRTRWGSCARDGVLSFSWRLVMAPPFVQDYVAAHEVAHLRHMDHGPRFWALVETLTPWRAEGMRWLTGEGARLLRIG